MVIQNTIKNLRLRSKEERTAVARSIAIASVVVLFLVWVFFFFHNFNAAPIQATAREAYSAAANAMEEIQVSSPASEKI